MTYYTHSELETEQLAERLAPLLCPGTVIAFDGDLGAGKTVFAKGFAAGLGINEAVNSPTYTIVQQYDSGRLPLYHFDVYRIGDVSEMDETGFEDCVYGSGVTLVKWAGLIEDIMPDNAVWVTIERDMNKGSEYRRIVTEDRPS